MLPLKELPPPSLTLVSRPELDREYRHFEHAEAVPFDAASIGFSPRHAWWLAEAALLTYWPPDQASTIFRDAAGLECEYIDDDGTQCYVAWNDAAAIVTFRGTQPNQPIDVWTDLDATPEPWIHQGEHVHGGFRRALSDAVADRIVDRLRAVPGRSVWMTGHSLGAALATLFADRMPGSVGVYTFGAPRVGDPAFALGFNQRHAGRSFRYVNRDDVVTHVPPPKLLDFAFEHVDREIRLDGGSPVRPTSTLVGPVIDHTPRRYAVLVWNALVGALAPSALE